MKKLFDLLVETRLMHYIEEDEQYVMTGAYYLNVYDDAKYNSGYKEVTYIEVVNDKFIAYSADADENYELTDENVSLHKLISNPVDYLTAMLEDEVELAD